MSLNVNPAKLTTFARHANEHATAIRSAAQPIRVDRTTLGTFEEATTLVDKLNSQIEDVRARLTAVADTLDALAQVATDAASLTGSTDADVHATMTRISSTLQTIDLQQAAAAQKDRDEHPVFYVARKPMAI